MGALNLAAFEINGSPSEDPSSGDRGYLALSAEALTIGLEGDTSDINRVTFEVYDATDGNSPRKSYQAPDITFVSSSTPRVTSTNAADTFAINLPASATAHTWEVRCTVTFQRRGTVTETQVFSRFVSIFKGAIRKELANETSEYYQAGPSVMQNLLVEALGAGVGGIVTIADAINFGHTVDADDFITFQSGGIGVNVGPGSAAALGMLNVARLGGGVSGLAVGNLPIAYVSGTTSTFAGSAEAFLRVGSSDVLRVGAATLGFGAAIVSPILNQIDDATVGVTADTLKIHAQNATAATGSNVAGALHLVGGQAVTAGTGNRTGGDVIIDPGAGANGAGTNLDGVVRIRSAVGANVFIVGASGAMLTGSLAMTELGAAPTPIANTGYVYTQDVAGVTELFYRNSTGISQLTSGLATGWAGSLAISRFSGGGGTNNPTIAIGDSLVFATAGTERGAIDSYVAVPGFLRVRTVGTGEVYSGLVLEEGANAAIIIAAEIGGSARYLQSDGEFNIQTVDDLLLTAGESVWISATDGVQIDAGDGSIEAKFGLGGNVSYWEDGVEFARLQGPSATDQGLFFGPGLSYAKIAFYAVSATGGGQNLYLEAQGDSVGNGGFVQLIGGVGAVGGGGVTITGRNAGVGGGGAGGSIALTAGAKDGAGANGTITASVSGVTSGFVVSDALTAFVAPISVTTGGPVASSLSNAMIRLPGNGTVLVSARNAANSGNVTVLQIDGANTPYLGHDTENSFVALRAATQVVFRAGAANRATITTSALGLEIPAVLYGSTVVAPSISQTTTTVAATAETLTIRSQVNGTTSGSTAGGTLFLNAGGATGVGTGARTGGSVVVRPGAGSGGDGALADGTIQFQTAAGATVALVRLGQLEMQGSNQVDWNTSAALSIANTNFLTSTASLSSFAQALSVTTAAAPVSATGTIRLPTGGSIRGRNPGDSLDMIGLTFGINIDVGESTNVPRVIVNQATQFHVQIAGTDRFTLTSTTAEYTVASLRFDSSVANPIVHHEAVGDATGSGMFVQAQGNNSATLAAGGLFLRGGQNAGAGAQGGVFLQTNNVTRLSVFGSGTRVELLGGVDFNFANEIDVRRQATSYITSTSGIVNIPIGVLAVGGANLPTVGRVRLERTTTLLATRNAAFSQNLLLLGLNNDNITIGDIAAGGFNGSIQMGIPTGFAFQWLQNGVVLANLNTAGFELLLSPFKFDSAVASPLITQETLTGAVDGNGQTFTVRAQAGLNGGGSGTLGEGGWLMLEGGQPASSSRYGGEAHLVGAPANQAGDDIWHGGAKLSARGLNGTLKVIAEALNYSSSGNVSTTQKFHLLNDTYLDFYRGFGVGEAVITLRDDAIIQTATASGVSAERVMALAPVGSTSPTNLNLSFFDTQTGGYADMKDMVCGLYWGNVGTAPTADPTGGAFLWVEAGELRYNGPGTNVISTRTTAGAGLDLTVRAGGTSAGTAGTLYLQAPTGTAAHGNVVLRTHDNINALTLDSTLARFLVGVGTFLWSKDVNSPVLQQSDQTVGGTAGRTISILSQGHTATSGGNAVAGDIALTAGSATGANAGNTNHGGDIILTAGRGQNGGTSIEGLVAFYAGGSIKASAVSTGFQIDQNNLQFANLLTPIITQVTKTSGGAGGLMLIHAQDHSGGSSTGGALDIRPGSGTTTGGVGRLLTGGATARIAWDDSGVAIGAIPTWQAMVGGLFVANAGTAPTGNPAGGIFLFGSGGGLAGRGSGGTTTTLAAA